MKHLIRLLTALAFLAVVSCTSNPGTPSETSESNRDYFQLKIYKYDTVNQESILDDYFEHAYLPALHRAGIEEVGVFKPIQDLNEDLQYTILLLKLKSLEQLESIPESLSMDEAYQETGTSYMDAPYDHPPFSRIESYLLRAMSESPHLVKPDLGTERSQRVYELRSYESATEKLYGLKVEMFNQGESDLFRNLEFHPVFFAEVLSSAHMPHLMYMISFADTTAQQEHWEAFRDSPEWKEMSQMERYQNTVSHITRFLLYPAAYSDY